MKQQKRQNAFQENKRSRFKIASVIACLIIALYSGYWFFLSISGQNIITTWQNNLARTGGILNYTGLSVSGFPFSVQTSVKGLSVSLPDKTQWEIPVFSVSVNPLNLQNIVVTAPGNNIMLGTDETPIILKFSNLTMSSKTEGSSNTAAYSFSTESVNLEAASNAKKTGKKAYFDYLGFNFTVSPQFGTLNPSPEVLKKWQQQNGTVTIDDITIKKADMSAVISGKTSFAPPAAPVFEGTLSVKRFNEFIAELVQQGIINNADNTLPLINGLAMSLNGGKPVSPDETLNVPLKTSGSGIITAGSFPLFKLPEFK